jgi:transcriptional regulator with PAS, ATPase and Fis domain
LRDRLEDIEPLAKHFLETFSIKYNIEAPELSIEAIDKLQQYPWPGNIRELSHLMEKLLFTCKKPMISARDLLLENIVLSTTDGDNNSTEYLTNNTAISLDEIEKLALISRLKHHRGNATETAKSLGLSRSGFYRRMSKYGLD